MVFNNKKLKDINKDDVEQLITDKVIECKVIDYKQELPGGKDADKKEFLYDVSSFANASGGHMLFGIVEDKGLPTKIIGLKNIDPDNEKTRLESIIKSGISPRIPGIEIMAVNIDINTWLIIIQIQKSWAQPHMVSFQDASRFYSRHSSGKYLLDVDEIRTQFNLSEAIGERIKNFREKRLSMIISEETPVPMYKNAKIVLHIIPISAFATSSKFDLTTRDLNTNCKPLCSPGWNYRYNFDGHLSYCAYRYDGTLPIASYFQLFRNGIIETVDSQMLMTKIVPLMYEKEILEVIPRYMKIYDELGIAPPALIMLSLVGVKGYSMETNRPKYTVIDPMSIDRDILVVPEILIDEFNIDFAKILRPIFDSVWNAAGWKNSLNYNASGDWVEHR